MGEDSLNSIGSELATSEIRAQVVGLLLGVSWAQMGTRNEGMIVDVFEFATVAIRDT